MERTDGAHEHDARPAEPLLTEPLPAQQGKVWLLDGRNRLDALAASGYDVEAFLKSKPSRLHYRAPNDDPEEVVVRLNIFRRHLTQEQKRDLVAKLLKATPERSNTDTARLALVDPNANGTGGQLSGIQRCRGPGA